MSSVPKPSSKDNDSKLKSVTTLLIVGGTFAFPSTTVTVVAIPTALVSIAKNIINATNNNEITFIVPHIFLDFFLPRNITNSSIIAVRKIASKPGIDFPAFSDTSSTGVSFPL